MYIMSEDIIPKRLKENGSANNHYKNIIRDCLILGGSIMLLTLPYFKSYIFLPPFISILSILSLAVLAGILDSYIKRSIIIDIGVSIIAFLIFEYNAVITYQDYGIVNLFFIVNQILSLIFFISIYYSVKGACNLFINNRATFEK